MRQRCAAEGSLHLPGSGGGGRGAPPASSRKWRCVSHTLKVLVIVQPDLLQQYMYITQLKRWITAPRSQAHAPGSGGGGLGAPGSGGGGRGAPG
jgi:hypothetical protein